MRKQIWIAPDQTVWDMEMKGHAHIFETLNAEAVKAVPHHSALESDEQGWALIDQGWTRVGWDSIYHSLCIQCTHKGLAHKAIRAITRYGLYFETLYLDIDASAFSMALNESETIQFCRRSILPLAK